MSIASDAQDDALHNYYQNYKNGDFVGVSTPITPVTNTPFQPSTKRAANLYLNVFTVAPLTISIGPTSACTIPVQASESSAIGITTLDIPAGWWVNLTGTMADLSVIAVGK
jgi:hypothetical protein